MFALFWSKLLVVTLAKLVRKYGDDVAAVTWTGTVISTWPPLETVPRSHENEVPPAAPVQLVEVALPLVTTATGAPVSSMLAGSESVTATSSASASPPPDTTSTPRMKSKSSSRATVPGPFLVIATSVRVLRVVSCEAVLFARLVSQPLSVSSDLTSTLLSIVPLASPSTLMVTVSDAFASITPQLHSSVPPKEPTAGTVVQVPPPETVWLW